MAQISLQSTAKMLSGHGIPLIGLGVYQNYSCIPACEAALEYGYRHIDTAQMYKNEGDVGKAIASSGIPRGEIFITTKVIHGSHGYKSTLETVDQSLQNLAVSYIDLYLIHSPLSGKEKRLETYKALLEARDAGKIRTVGVSNYGVHHLEEIHAAGLETPSVNQIELHPLCQQKEIVDYCKERGILVEAYCPLIRGDFSSPTLQEVVKSSGKTAAQVLVRWSLQKGYVPLPKSSDPERVRKNAEVFDFSLTEEEMKKLDSLDKGKDGAISWNPVHVL